MQQQIFILASPLKSKISWPVALASLIIGIGLFVGECKGQTAGLCGDLDSVTKSHIARMAAIQFQTGSTLPTIIADRLVSDSCYRQIMLSVPTSNRRLSVYLSPDRRFLFPALWDVSSDPDIAEADLGAALLREARAAGAPSAGTDSGSVNVVIFSDFQCPYCANLAAMITKQSEKTSGPATRIVFRNLPLPAHDWAATAARSGICIAQQSQQLFWRFHDMLFAKQKTLSAQSLGAATSRFLVDNKEINPANYLECLASSYPDSSLARDQADANLHDVHATPTVFINGRKYVGFRDEVAFNAALESAVKKDVKGDSIQ